MATVQTTPQPTAPVRTETSTRQRGPTYRARAVSNYAIFAVVAITAGWIGIALDKATAAPASNSVGMLLWILLPAIVAVLLVRFRRDGGGPLGLTLRFPHRARWFTLAGVFYLPFTAIIVLAGIAAGVSTFNVPGSIGWGNLIVAMAVAVPTLAVKNTVEEFIFRGFGTRTAVAAGFPRLWSHVVVGLTWGVWHMPLYVYWMSRVDFRNTTSLPWALFIPVFFIGVIAVAVVFGELRLRTGSIWPGVLMHTMGGALVNTLILDGYLRFSGHGDVFFSPVPNSVASILLFGLIGLVMLRLLHSTSARTGVLTA